MFLKSTVLLRLIRILVFIVLTLIVVFMLIFGFLGIKEFKPAPIETVYSESNYDFPTEFVEVPVNTDLSLLTWNVGYGALGDNADFFMDGGKQVYTATKARVQENINEINSFITQQDVDFIFLQEVDVDSCRSYSINEKEIFQTSLPDYDSYFAINFKVPFVPYPLPPIGKVNSGIQSLSKYKVVSGQRYSLPCPFKIPVRYGNLKRCMLVNRFKVNGRDNELVFINVHLEAYDSGEGKIAQTKVVKKLIEDEFDKGNYVIVAGDFNQTFSNVVLSEYPHISDKIWKAGLVNIELYKKDFSFWMDNTYPSCRSLDKPYTDTYKGLSPKKDFQFYVIDGFIVSSNVQVKSISTLDNNFRNSDHNPVKMIISLK